MEAEDKMNIQAPASG
jgi:hypothetical protein